MTYFKLKNLLVFVQPEDKKLVITGLGIPATVAADDAGCGCTCTCTATGGGGCGCTCSCTCTGSGQLGDVGLERINPAELSVLQEALKEAMGELERLERDRPR